MSELNELSWQSAVAELTAERERAETAVGIIKRLGGPGDLTAAEIAYGDGRAETEAVIAALTVALERGQGRRRPRRPRRPHRARHRRPRDPRPPRPATSPPAPAARPSTCSPAPCRRSSPPSAPSGSRRGDRDAATRATIAARLDAARWPPFADIAA